MEMMTEKCEMVCQNVNNDPIVKLYYYKEAFEEQLSTDTNSTKYIKVTTQIGDNGVKDGGSFAKSEPILLFCFSLMTLIYFQ